MREAWLPAPAFAAIAGVTPRSASRILFLAFDGRPWRSTELSVRKVRGRGRGGWAYEVRADSLPEELREVALAARSPAPAPASAAPRPPASAPGAAAAIDKPSPVARWRYEVIEPILQCARASKERAQAIEETARVVRDHPGGRRRRLGKSTLRRWIDAYEREGMAGLRRKAPANRGQGRVAISRAWDAAVPFNAEAKARIAEVVSKDVRSLWAANTSWGWRQIARAAGDTLAKETVSAGFDPGARRLRAICRLSRHVVERGRRYRAKAIHDQDRKRYADRSMPRVRRTREGRKPMEIVIGDVHHLDILLRRDDGSTYTPKLIAWLDWATNRVFGYPVFLPKGQGVRQEHVIEAFVAMVEDPRWGMPDTLYLDNGGEYNWAELIDDAMQLSSRMRLLDGDPEFASSVRARRSAIVRSLPYNAAAKSIEGAFATLEAGAFSTLPGWIGGNRMRKKTANVGKEPAPYPGDEHAFRRSLNVALDWYDTQPQEGFLGGRSPRQAFAAFVEGGWERAHIDPDVLRVIFSRPEGRTIRQGRISFAGASYTAPALWPLPADTKVEIRVPLIGDRRELCVLDAGGEFLCMAEPETPYDALDPEGAREAARRRRVAEAAYRDMGRDIDPVDMEARVAEVVSREEPAPIPERGNVIGMGERLERIAREIGRSPAESQTIEAAKAARAEQHRAITRHAQDEFLRALGGSTPLCAASPESGGMSDERRQAIDALLKGRGASG